MKHVSLRPQMTPTTLGSPVERLGLFLPPGRDLEAEPPSTVSHSDLLFLWFVYTITLLYESQITLSKYVNIMY